MPSEFLNDRLQLLLHLSRLMHDAIEDLSGHGDGGVSDLYDRFVGWARRVEAPALAEMPPFQRVTGPTTRMHIRATLRAVLNAAITQEIITFNPAAHVELDPVRRPKALVWTEERVARFAVTGEKPSPVMVWTPARVGAFLDFVAKDELYALFHLVSLRGLRRGEACGLRWEDVDLRSGTVTIATQLVEENRRRDRREQAESDAGNRVVALDGGTIDVRRKHRALQGKAQLAAGEAWVDSGRVFTRQPANGCHPTGCPITSTGWWGRAACHQSACAFSGTAPRRSPWQRAPT